MTAPANGVPGQVVQRFLDRCTAFHGFECLRGMIIILRETGKDVYIAKKRLFISYKAAWFVRSAEEDVSVYIVIIIDGLRLAN